MSVNRLLFTCPPPLKNTYFTFHPDFLFFSYLFYYAGTVAIRAQKATTREMTTMEKALQPSTPRSSRVTPPPGVLRGGFPLSRPRASWFSWRTRERAWGTTRSHSTRRSAAPRSSSCCTCATAPGKKGRNLLNIEATSLPVLNCGVSFVGSIFKRLLRIRSAVCAQQLYELYR